MLLFEVRWIDGEMRKKNCEGEAKDAFVFILTIFPHWFPITLVTVIVVIVIIIFFVSGCAWLIVLSHSV